VTPRILRLDMDCKKNSTLPECSKITDQPCLAAFKDTFCYADGLNNIYTWFSKYESLVKDWCKSKTDGNAPASGAPAPAPGSDNITDGLN